MIINESLKKNYDIVLVKTSKGLVVEHTNLKLKNRIYKDEGDLVKEVGNCRYIVLESVNG